jgi:hypothetical protein
MLPVRRPVTGFHNRTVPSPQAMASGLPLGLNATAPVLNTGPVGTGVPTGWPVAGFHRRTVPPHALGAAGQNATDPPAGILPTRTGAVAAFGEDGAA